MFQVCEKSKFVLSIDIMICYYFNEVYRKFVLFS